MTHFQFGFAVPSRRAALTLATLITFTAILGATPARAQDVTTEFPDYYPGDIVVITGGGFWPGERISLRLDQHPTLHDPYVFYSTADSAGAFRNADYTVEDQDLGTSFDLIATGLSSGIVATSFFTDSPKVGSVTVVPSGGEMCNNDGGSVTYTITVNRGSGSGSNGSFTANLSVTSALPSGVSATFSPNPVAFTSGQDTRTATLTLSASSPVPAGSTGFTVRASTSANDFATGTELLTVNQLPTITAPAPITRNNDAGKCGAVVTFAATATGNPTPTLSYAPASGTLFPVGTTTVTATATNSCGSASTTFTVTVVDNEKPVITVADLSRPTDAGVCAATIASLGATASDNCTVSTLVGTRSDAAVLSAAFPKGTTTVTWVATDNHGNSATATQQVTVVDTEKPTVTPPAGLNTVTGPGASICGLVVSDAALGTAVGHDNCSVTIQRTGVPAGNLFPVGATTITYTATDGSGNTASATQTVTVADTTPPVVTVAPITLESESGVCSASVGSLGASAADNCGVASLIGLRSDALALTAAYPVGTTTITWTATDVHGNSGTATQSVTVTDHQKPVIASADRTVSNDPGVCSAVVTLGTTATDNCGVASLVGTRGDGLALTDPFPKGTTTVSWLATDVHGNTSAATQHVTVNDTENPTISAPAALNLTTGPGATQCGLLVSDATLGSPTAHDNCGVSVLRTGVPAGNFFPVGMTTITYTATDPSGNTAVATQTVTVVDNTPPTIATSNLSSDTDAGSCAAVFGSLQTTAADNCDVASLVGVRSDAAALTDPFPAGLTTISWTATDVHGNTSSATQTVTVTDHELPVITAADHTVSNDPGACSAVVTLGTTASDNCGIASLVGTRDDGLALAEPFPKGTTTVSWLATDVHGNASNATQHVTVNDTENPTLSAPAALNLTTGAGAIQCGLLITDATLGTPTAHDNCEVSVERTGVPAGNFFPVGTTTITYTATDPSGNTAVATQTVTVVDDTPPTITVSNFDVNTDAGLCSAAIGSLGASAEDNCGVDSFGGTRSDAKPLSDPFPVGVTTITWTATDIHGNTGSATQTVTVTDHELPVITTADHTVSNDPGVCSAVVTLGTTASDNCDIASLVGTRDDGLPLTDPFPKGMTTVSWLATDVHGNTATATQRVTVNDTENPTISAPAALNLTTGPSATQCGLLVSDATLGTPTAHDNCGVSVERTGVPAGNFFPVGTTTITYTAKDPSGNTAVATQTVTVVDDTPPTVTVMDLSVATGHGACSASIGSLGASASDNCGIDTFVGTRGDGLALTDAFPKGMTTITWLATDVHGNTHSATQTVTVTDHELPTITVSDLSVATDPGVCGAAIATLGTSAADNCGVASLVGTRDDGHPLSDIFPTGTTTISWLATDVNGNQAGATQHVRVADTEHPTLAAPASLSRTTGPGSQTCGVVVGNAALGTPVAHDNCDVTVTVDGVPAGNLFPVGVTTLTWTATDPSGNSTSATQTVAVVDDTPPVFTAHAPRVLNTDPGICGAVLGPITAAATDNCGVQSATPVRSDGLGMSDPFPVGTTTITWTVTDVHGNSSSGTETVRVEDHQAPSIAAPAAVNAATGPGARICGAVISDAALGQPTASDNCSVTLTRTGVPSGNVFPVGTTVVTWTATDPSGNSLSATQAVTVVDNTPPTLTVPAAVAQGTGPNATQCGLVVPDATLGAATATDNCSVTLNRTGVPAGNLFPKGTTTITYTATDPSGNTTTLTQTVTITDTTPPRITSANVTRATDAGLCTAAIANLGVTATDNCGTPTLTSARSDAKSLSDPFPKGVTTVLWTATDASGNTTTATQTVTITNAAPAASITSPSSGFIVAIGTPVTLSGVFMDDAGDKHTATWSCDATTLAATVNETARTAGGSITFTTAGVYRVQLTVTDQCGVTSTATQVGGLDAMIVAYDPNAGFVTGGGWIDSPAGSYAPNPALVGKANFGFVSKYKKGMTVPTGETEFQFKAGDVDFHSASYDWLVISGARAQFKGTGTINGAGNFGFLLSAVDGETPGGGGKDKFRMKITDKASGQVVYDNMMGVADSSAAATLLGGGSITIQANGGKASASVNGTIDAAGAAPAVSGLANNYPNPFNPETTLRFTMARAGRATLRVFDARGALVRTLVNDALEAGAHEARWNGLDDRGGRVRSGVYYALFTAADGARDRIRMVLIK